MAQMTADSAVLAKEASNFERISSELKGVIAQVESTTSSLAASGVDRPRLPLRVRCSAFTKLPAVRFKRSMTSPTTSIQPVPTTRRPTTTGPKRSPRR
jgi:hypothetical protein